MTELQSNPRGIPQAPFVSKVEEFVHSQEEVEPTLRKFAEMIEKFKFMEDQLLRKRRSLDDKIPELKKTLEMVDFLQARSSPNPDADPEEEDAPSADEPLDVTYELNDTLWAHAKISKSEVVYLWLGANLMVEYPVTEAHTLLNEKLSTAQNSLKVTIEDLEFLREQITTMEVNIARVYNWDVKQRRMTREGKSG
ncbi:Prefoldin, subunit 3 [Gonapodya prolifera JEL478]|uniref:Prefoldin subunit 3 n=1 Tax=Gonapodya prolifera (strain JEL478) TaxID=1344416 RepID=A0A139ACB2_GONPJ|nr:Prefoldin, subunit 3 [Gonapodya prolifera JEL478]|eukprot:KXS14378.1 Prefoldin, subunit 3 [Gonapodya prolifera JEL478]